MRQVLAPATAKPSTMPDCATSDGGARQVEIKQARQHLVVGQVGRPAVGGGDGFIEGAMQVVEPDALGGAAHVVEVGEGAGLQDGGRFRIARDDAVRKAGDDLGDAFDQVGGVGPSAALFIEAACGGGAGLGGGGGGVGRGGKVGCKAGRERKGFECGGGRVARAVFQR